MWYVMYVSLQYYSEGLLLQIPTRKYNRYEIHFYNQNNVLDYINIMHVAIYHK